METVNKVVRGTLFILVWIAGVIAITVTSYPYVQRIFFLVAIRYVNVGELTMYVLGLMIVWFMPFVVVELMEVVPKNMGTLRLAVVYVLSGGVFTFIASMVFYFVVIKLALPATYTIDGSKGVFNPPTSFLLAIDLVFYMQLLGYPVFVELLARSQRRQFFKYPLYSLLSLIGMVGIMSLVMIVIWPFAQPWVADMIDERMIPDGGTVLGSLLIVAVANVPLFLKLPFDALTWRKKPVLTVVR